VRCYARPVDASLAAVLAELADEPAPSSRRPYGPIAFAAARLEAPPCDRCPHRARCAVARLACAGFVAFVNGTGDQTPATPRRDLYRRLFPGERVRRAWRA